MLNFRKFSVFWSRTCRHYSEHRSVYLSQSNDIFTNLALEDWIYKNFDFSKQTLLLLWRNNPCIVIGRHQNPLVEANVNEETGVKLARRNSGGGTVYHDLGNLNCTFFTSREKYNRKKNLETICRALNETWGFDTHVSPREDIMINGDLKISGTASKLGGKNAYHHCTVLIDVDVEKLREVLKPSDIGIDSKATPSVRSRVTNLKRLNPSVSVELILEAVGDYFLNEVGNEYRKGFTYVRPTNSWFPGLDKLVSEFSSWDWIHGKTPRFTVRQNIEELSARVEIQCYHGCLEKTQFLRINSDVADDLLKEKTEFWNRLLQGQKLNKDLVSNLANNQVHFCSASKDIIEILKSICR